MPKIIHIRSLTPGSIPTTSSLGVGEIAINVPDGKAFLRQSGSQGDTIQSFVTTNSTTSGSINISGSVTLTGSLNILGSTTQIGNNNLFGNTTLSGSIIISGSTTTPTVQVYGNITHDGYVRFNPVSTNIDTSISASYIYVSGSTNDLYFSQNGEGYSNTTRLRWLEGNLYTGLLSGGVISASLGTNTYSISSGTGIVVSLNATTSSRDPFPTVQYLKWNTLTDTIDAHSASFDQSFVAINNTATITAQGIPFTDGDFNTKIPIGVIIHQNRSSINAYQTFPSVGYGWKQRTSDFVKAFGPLKISGYTLSPSSSAGVNSTGSLVLDGGTAWVDGRNYIVDPNNPSYISEAVGITTSKIYRYHQTGSGFVYQTNGGAGFETIDPTRYSNNGTLTLLTNNNRWSIQRVFYFPNSATKAFYIYYGNAEYSDKAAAKAAIATEPFTEAPNTTANAIFIGYMLLQKIADFTSATTYEIIPAGLFRGGGSTGASIAAGATALSGLSDVAIASLNTGDLLIYNALGASQWNNSKTLTGNYVITGSLNLTNGVTGSLFGTSSYAITSSYSISSSFATTTQFAPDYVLNSVTSSMLSPYVLTASTSSMTVLSSSFAATASLAPLYLLIDATSSMLSPYVLTSSTSSMTVAFANTASYVTSSNVYGPLGANSVLSASFALSASWAPGGTGAGFPFVGNAQITGSLLVTGSTSLNYTNTQTYKIDSTTAGPTTLATITTGSNTSAFVNYTINRAANARAGQLIAVWYGTSSQYTDVSTLDIGDTTEFAFTASIVSSNLEISENATSGWSVKMLVNLV